MTSRSTPAPYLLVEKEAAEILGFSTRTLQKWRSDGGGPKFVHVSKRAIRYRQEDLLRWIEERVRTSTSDHGDAAR
jgi:predicted DNA-binding transcriptional regulator AlpA